jgi:hypothetical protein
VYKSGGGGGEADISRPGLAGLGEKALQLSKATGVTAQKSLVFPKATRGVVASR